MSNPGLIWLDEESARRLIGEKERAGEVTGEEGENLRKFAVDGYFVTKVNVTAEDAAEIDRDVDRLWREKPSNLSFAYDSPPLRFSASDEGTQRRPRYRIHELHNMSPVALRLSLDSRLHRYASLILGEPAIATQSLYFEFGSQQMLHRDSTVVPTPEFGRLVAAWIALEDITEESGPLAYVPGSQKFPFCGLRDDEEYVYDPSRHTVAEVERAVRFYDDELKKSGLPTHHFLAKRGEVLVWHSALMHGGAPPASPERTRKSYVVHYSTLRNNRTRLCAVSEPVDGVPGESVFECDSILERDGAYAFGNPLEGRFLYRR
ncbi:MAG TPA: phytanoyl-CoA dioxygenase family protein [Vicinamibacterales bacterium]